MRSYLTSLIFEKLFDNVPDNDKDVYNLAQMVISPRVKIVEESCGTTVGEIETIGYRMEGEIELSTNTPLSKTRINYLLSQGIYEVATVHVHKCTSKGGVCARCFSSEFQEQPVPIVGDYVVIPSEKIIHIDVLAGSLGQNNYQLSMDASLFNRVRLYHNGILKPTSSYSISGYTLIIDFSIAEEEHLVIKYVDATTTPLMGYLSDTYSGSLLGLEALPTLSTSIKSGLLKEIIPEGRLELIANRIKSLDIPVDQSEYIDKIIDPLEKLLYVVALYTIYTNVL
jgi:hypothetical protein